MTYAGFWKRVIASFIDGFILMVADFVIKLMMFAILGMSDGVDIAATIFTFVFWIIYFSVQESSAAQATLGKRALGIIVTDIDGNRIDFGTGIGRTLGKLLSWVILLIGFVMVAFTARKQGLHDLMADTLVVDRNSVSVGEKKTDTSSPYTERKAPPKPFAGFQDVPKQPESSNQSDKYLSDGR